jgi:propanediol dehydratase large subunit
MVACKDFVDAIAGIKEGAGTLLDNTLIFAHSDCSIAKSHAVEGIPMMVIGGGGGKIKTGYHKAGKADSASRMGLSLQQAMGVQVERWGVQSMDTNRTITELVA